ITSEHRQLAVKTFEKAAIPASSGGFFAGQPAFGLEQGLTQQAPFLNQVKSTRLVDAAGPGLHGCPTRFAADVAQSGSQMAVSGSTRSAPLRKSLRALPNRR